MQFSDERTYMTLATNVAEGRGLPLATDAPYEPSAVRGPVYPLFLALLQRLGVGSVLAVGVVQALLDALSGLLLALAARELVGGVAPALALVLWTLLGPGGGV